MAGGFSAARELIAARVRAGLTQSEIAQRMGTPQSVVELEQQYKASANHAKKVAEAKAEMTYEVAKEKCDDMPGDAKSACVKQAKAQHDGAKAEIKRMKG